MPPLCDASLSLQPGEQLPAFIAADAGEGNTLTLLTGATTPTATAPAYEMVSAGGLLLASGDAGLETGAGRIRRVWATADADAYAVPGRVFYVRFTGTYRVTGESFNRKFRRLIRVEVLEDL
jgi:hypothetical protein